MIRSPHRLAVLFTLLLFPVYQGPAKPMNVLFIPVDDLNDYISLLNNYPGIKTPNLERLAERSVTFKYAYCAGPICNPSRTSLLTGLAPHQTGIYSNRDHWVQSKPANDALALPEAFRAAGYTTLWAGKLFHDLSAPSKARLENMWDDTGTNVPGALYDGSTNLVPYGPATPLGYGAIEPDALFPDVANAKLAREWLEQDHGGKPFFMVVGIIRPHSPFTAPQKFFDMYPLETLELPPGFREDDLDDVPDRGKELAGPQWLDRIRGLGRWKEVLQAYLASVSFADDSIGKVIDALDESPYRDNTMIILWGDHGYHLGEKKHSGKSTLWEQGTRNLLMISVPGMDHGGDVCQSPVSLLDIYPTLQGICDLGPVAQELAGLDISSLLENPAGSRGEPVLTSYPYNCHAVRDDRWRYIRYADGAEELYDHHRDPHEWENLANDPANRPVIERLRSWLPATNGEPVGPTEGLFDWQESRKRIKSTYDTFGNAFDERY